MNSAECEFLAECQPIRIIPSFTDTTMHLITGDVGPFEAGQPLDGVPMWLAVYLKQCRKCRVVPPDWLTVANLEANISNETDSAQFSPLAKDQLSVAHLLLQHAADDLVDADRLMVLVRDLSDARQAKLRTSVTQFLESGQSHAVVQNLTPMEMCSIRPFLMNSLDALRRMKRIAGHQGDPTAVND